YAAKITDVEEAVMRGAIVAGKATAIHAENDRKILEADVVNDGIESALKECGINCDNRLQALGGEARGEEHGVFFGNAHIEIFSGMPSLEAVKHGAVRHRRGDSHDIRITVRKFNQRLGKDFGVRRLAGRLRF